MIEMETVFRVALKMLGIQAAKQRAETKKEIVADPIPQQL